MLEAVAAVPATTTPGVAVMLYSKPAMTPAPTPLVAVAAAVEATARVSKAAVIPDANRPRVQDRVAMMGEAVCVPTWNAVYVPKARSSTAPMVHFEVNVTVTLKLPATVAACVVESPASKVATPKTMAFSFFMILDFLLKADT